MNETHIPSRPRSTMGKRVAANRSIEADSARSQAGCTYVVQLALSGAAIDPIVIPKLDIFDVYRLYSISGSSDGVTRHALRLGFFKEARTARTISRYLESFFDAPAVLQVGASEERLASNQSLVALKDIGASGRHAIIELSTPRAVTTDTPRAGEPAPQRNAARTSLWLRLLTTLRG